MKRVWLVLAALCCLCSLVSAESSTIKITFIPSYANSTNITSSDNTVTANITMVRIYGFLYDDTVEEYHIPDDIRNWLNTLNLTDLNDHEIALLANRTAPFLWSLIPNEIVNVTFSNNATYQTTNATGQDGRFDEFIPVINLPDGPTVNFTSTTLNGTFSGVDVLPTADGQAIVSDIDDVLRVTRVYDPSQGLQSTFLEDYVPVPGMPELFSQWENTLANASFHYVTTTPIQLSQAYAEWLSSVYPFGSLDMRPTDLRQPDAILQARSDALHKLLETFPSRKFSFLGDTSSITLLKAYPDLEQQFPDSVQCIFIRNITATDPSFSGTFTPLELEVAFQNVPRNKWFVYDDSTQLASIDLAGGSCWPPGYAPSPPAQITTGLAVSGATENVVGLVTLAGLLTILI